MEKKRKKSFELIEILTYAIAYYSIHYLRFIKFRDTIICHITSHHQRHARRRRKHQDTQEALFV